MTTDALPLDLPPIPAPERVEHLSPDQRRTRRQQQAIATGSHPLALLWPDVRRHPDTLTQAYTRDDERGRPLTCGTCRWREVAKHRDRAFPKCRLPGTDRASHGSATDVRAWWPACDQWQEAGPC